jgi:hypothetical protein
VPNIRKIFTRAFPAFDTADIATLSLENESKATAVSLRVFSTMFSIDILYSLKAS